MRTPLQLIMSSNNPTLPPILVIDDSEDDLFFLKRLLVKSGTQFPILTFTSATDAVRYLTQAVEAMHVGHVPCFIFTDLKMPTMTGLEFLAWMRAQKRINRLPVVMLTTSDDPKDIARSAELGVDGYYVKFPSAAEITKLLEQAGEPRSSTSGD